MIYLDNAATTPLNLEVKKTIESVMDKYFMNANSGYWPAININDLQEKGRHTLADLLKIHKDELIFTGSGSESNNMAIKGIAFKYLNKSSKHIITSSIEHSSVYETCKQLEGLGFEVTYLQPDQYGHINKQEILDNIKDNTILISVTKINSELGAMNKVEDIYKEIKAKNKQTILHIDCVQAFGKYDLDFSKMDLASMSAHKINGIKGSALLYKRNNVTLLPLICGGEQEYGLRAGTSNYYYNIPFAKTYKLFLAKKESSSIDDIYHTMIDLFNKDERIHINSPLEDCSHYIINISIPDYKSEVILNALEAEEIYISTKSACSTNVKRSRILDALPIEDKYKDTAFRISFSLDTTLEEINTFYNKLSSILDNLVKG